MQLKNAVGRYAESYSYDDSGTIRGHTIPGCAYTDDGVPYLGGWPAFVGVHNIIGCGLSETGRIVYTRNGQRLDTGDLTVNSASELFPCVSLHAPLDEIEANFGPNFVFQNVDDI
uniref:B30.2/SPRY domain-containing protein n=1 Tax=Globodera pallida TaxID=36090 RepID=A0A183CQA4_GLOPA